MVGNLGELRLYEALSPAGTFSGNDIPSVPRHKGSIGTEVDLEEDSVQHESNIVGHNISSVIGQTKLAKWMGITPGMQSFPIPGKA